MSLLDKLPDEIMRNICQFLQYMDVNALAKTSDRHEDMLTEMGQNMEQEAVNFKERDVLAMRPAYYGIPCSCKKCTSCVEKQNEKNYYRDILAQLRRMHLYEFV